MSKLTVLSPQFVREEFIDLDLFLDGEQCGIVPAVGSRTIELAEGTHTLRAGAKKVLWSGSQEMNLFIGEGQHLTIRPVYNKDSELRHYTERGLLYGLVYFISYFLIDNFTNINSYFIIIFSTLLSSSVFYIDIFKVRRFWTLVLEKGELQV